MPALICRSISQSQTRHTKSLPTLSRRRAPHTGQVLLVHAGLTLITGTPAREGGLVLDLTVDFATGPRGEAPPHSTRVATRLKQREGFKDNGRSTFFREQHESFRNGMEPLIYSVMLPLSLPAEQAFGDPPVIDFLRCETPTAYEMSGLDLPHAVEGCRDEIRAVTGHDHTVHRVLVRVEGDRALRFVCLWRLPPDGDYDLPWNDRERTEAPQGIRKDRPMHVGQREI